tara:strand:+ start:7949 stop:9121 length:1173 start_codon:yes stop_codon:yes gene_type:complete
MFYKNFNFEIMTNVVSGPDSINKIHEFLVSKNYNRILVIQDQNLFSNSNYVKKFIKKIEKKYKAKLLFYEGYEEPTYQKLDFTINKLNSQKNNLFDCIIAIGGGSAIDFAKGVATILTNKGKSIKYRGFPSNLNLSIPIVAIPSTAGTGTELAYNAVFTDTKSKKKLGINTKNNYPKLSILDPKILSSCPKKVIFNSGMGALIRSIDTMCNKKSNEISEIFSKNAFKLLFNTLPKFMNKRKNLEYCSRMQWGAYLSVAALLNSSSGPAGALAYYLSTNYKIPQGIGYGIAGLHFFKQNHEKGYYGYSKFYELINKKNNNKILSEKAKSIYVINELYRIYEKGKKFVKKLKIKDIEIDKISTNVKKGNISNNPVKLNQKDLKKIIQKIIKK